MTSSINSTLNNLLSVNMLSDTAIDRINESLSKDNKVEKAEPKTDEEKAAVSSETDDTEDVEETVEESYYKNLFEIDYNKEDASSEIGNYIKKYTSAISDYLTYKSETKVSLGESSLKDVLKNKFKVNISKSAYNDVGMGEYYNLKNILNYSQSLSSSQSGNIINSNIIKNFTNFSISV